jgi:hypothetical protein
MQPIRQICLRWCPGTSMCVHCSHLCATLIWGLSAPPAISIQSLCQQPQLPKVAYRVLLSAIVECLKLCATSIWGLSASPAVSIQPVSAAAAYGGGTLRTFVARSQRADLVKLSFCARRFCTL